MIESIRQLVPPKLCARTDRRSLLISSGSIKQLAAFLALLLFAFPRGWSGKGFFNGPPIDKYSISYCGWAKARFSTPLRHGFLLPLMGYENISTRVVGLFNGCRPTAIRFTVTEIIINSFYRHSKRRLTHIAEKVVKVMPRRANRDAPSTIARIFSGVGIFASAQHRLPRTIRLGRSSHSGMSVGDRSFPDRFRRNVSLQTSARTSVSRVKRISSGDYVSTALAHADPACLPVVLFADAALKDSKASKDGADHIHLMCREQYMYVAAMSKSKYANSMQTEVAI